MKTHTTAALIAAVLLGATISAAEELTVEAVQKPTEIPQTTDKKLRDAERTKALLEKKPVTYGGFLVDATRAEKKSRFFSLRQPRDPKNDMKNVALEERTGRPRGFVLFRAEF
jgi:hypothetical protein